MILAEQMAQPEGWGTRCRGASASVPWACATPFSLLLTGHCRDNAILLQFRDYFMNLMKISRGMKSPARSLASAVTDRDAGDVVRLPEDQRHFIF